MANVFETGELKEDATISKMETVQQEGNPRLENWMNYKYVQNLHILPQTGRTIIQSSTTLMPSSLWAIV